MLEQFHFLEPLWLLALLPLAAVFWLAFQKSTDSRSWEKIIDPKLLPLLLQGEDKNTHKLPKLLLALVWIIAVIALADPVWEKIPRPIFQTNAARVLVLDLSNSMLIDDMKPNRLARARFKIEDILSREEEGQTGLVLFAGEAYTAAPLTRDTETIRSMLKVLTPQIMPSQGSRADLGLVKAHELLKQAGINKGQVLLIADGVSQQSLGIKAATDLRNDGHTVSVMAVGTEAGGKLNFRDNTSISVKLDAESLSEIANKGGGKYSLITTNSTDIKRLLTPISDANSLGNKQVEDPNEQNLQNSDWHSTGPLLILVLLPFAALAFRRGWLLNVMLAFLIAGFIAQPQEVLAADQESQSASQNKLQGIVQNKWQENIEKLTKNKAQRANNALIRQQYEKARELAEDPMRRGSAEYKLEDYEAALASFKQSEGTDARYNEGNALAKLEKYKEAIAAYDESLKLNSNNQDASDNKKAIEDLLKQQQQSGKNNKSSNENQQSKSDSENDKQDQQSSNSKQNQDKQSGSQSEGKEGKQEQKNTQNNNEDKEKGKEQKNQFSDANKDIDKNKKEAEEEAIQAKKDQPTKGDKNKGKNSKPDKNDSSVTANKDAGEGSESLDEKAEVSEKSTEVSTSKVKDLAEELTKEEKMAAEQWLRRIPDDPGGLLRRKFRHQYNQTRRNSNSTEQPW